MKLCPKCEAVKLENQRLLEELNKAQQEVVDLHIMIKETRPEALR